MEASHTLSLNMFTEQVLLSTGWTISFSDCSYYRLWNWRLGFFLRPLRNRLFTAATHLLICLKCLAASLHCSHWLPMAAWPQVGPVNSAQHASVKIFWSLKDWEKWVLAVNLSFINLDLSFSLCPLCTLPCLASLTVLWSCDAGFEEEKNNLF